MSYHIYTTEGIVLKRVAFGEANLILYILTKDLGLIIASARSVRLDSSKLRSALQEYSSVTVSCIKGKNGWKITNAVEEENFFFEKSGEVQKVLAQIVSVLLKMIPGENIHPEIFIMVKSGFTLLKTLEGEKIKYLEILMVFRILHELGYVAGDIEQELLQNKEEWSTPVLERVKEKKETLVVTINKALKESHL
jgi:DNA repair protein RecO